MIAITSEIVGPGIEEEYADAQAAIDDIRVALGPQPLTNHTPDGSVLMEVKWVEQEIEARRLPIPVNDNWIRTILYLVGSNELGGVPGFKDAADRLALVLQGEGLMKPRHLPVLIALMDDFLAEAGHCSAKDPRSHALLDDIRREVEDLRHGGVWPKHRRPQDQFVLQRTPELEACIKRCRGRLMEIDTPLFYGWRPDPARKPPLSAPVPGLPETPPMLPPELEGKLP